MRDQITCDEQKYVVEIPPLSVMHMCSVKEQRLPVRTKYKMHFKFIQIVKTSRSVIISPALNRTFKFSPNFNLNVVSEVTASGTQCLFGMLVKMGDVLVNFGDITRVQPLSKTYILPNLQAHYSALIKPAPTSILRHFSPVETFVFPQCINQQLTLNVIQFMTSIKNFYLFRHWIVILRCPPIIKEYKPYMIIQVLHLLQRVVLVFFCSRTFPENGTLMPKHAGV